ncbi:tRNA (adenosine(37)-N6)-threonylcarbamoyltransferase complex transferase subunit TsaD, partial [Candidatus Gottesmanbacteria bacterium]|nr:tRNA (adenosine(37)-N6)-threonylcarbamoyltransferase complex transferase subunit TsaD [Candidatus Gottesmanbacteria bacterium]
EDGVKVLSNVVASSAAMHEKYGGIVPEVASREQLRCIIPVLTESIESGSGLKKGQTPLAVIKRHIDAIAVAVGPGLIGSLLVGVETAKTIALVTEKPIIPVNHVIAHMYANFVNPSIIPSEGEGSLAHASSNELRDSSATPQNDKKITFPAISLVVSGGHTELYLMKSIKDLAWLGGTLDDAAGEAFDKTARLLGFESRGGVAIQEAAKKCQMINPPAGEAGAKCQIKLPRPMIGDESLNFSFSGLKTAVMRQWKKCEDHSEKLTNAFAHEIQESITDVLVEKTLRTAKKYRVKSILLSGGVAANTRLREKFKASLIAYHLSPDRLFIPPVNLCTDNAVYIASYAFFRGHPADWHEVTACPDLNIEVQA